MTSIPVVGGLIFLSYKSFGENSIDESKLKPQKQPVVNKETAASDEKISKTKGQDLEMGNNSCTTTHEETLPSTQPAKVKQEIWTSSKKYPYEKSKALHQYQALMKKNNCQSLCPKASRQGIDM